MLEIIAKVMGIPIETQLGSFLSGAYRTIDSEKNRSADHVIVYLNHKERPCNLRINSACFTADIFGDTRCDCHQQLLYALEFIATERQGLLLYHLHHEGRANGVVEKLMSFQASDLRGAHGAQAYECIGLPADARQFRSSVLILQDLGINSVNLLSNNPKKQQILTEAGIQVRQLIPLISQDPSLKTYYDWKRKDFHHDV